MKQIGRPNGEKSKTIGAPTVEPRVRKNDPRLWTPADVSTFIGVSEPTLASWRYRRMGPTYLKFGSVVRYKSEDIAKFLEEYMVETERGSDAEEATVRRLLREGARRGRGASIDAA